MDDLLNVLKAACGQNIDTVKEAESILKELEAQEGFYAALLDIYFRKDLDVNIRWIAILCFKNGVIRNWKRLSKNSILEEEKTYLRNKLIGSFDEEITQLALQQAVVIGHIVRNDIRQWPDSIKTTLDAVKSENSLIQHRALLTLNQIIKQLASKRLVADRKIFEEISLCIFDLLFSWSKHYLLQIQEAVDFSNISQQYELLILITKISRKLIIHGPKNYEEGSLQIQYIILSLNNINILLQKFSIKEEHSLKEKNEKQILLTMKLISDFLETHAQSFLPLLATCLRLCLETILSASSTCSFPMFVIYCSNILRMIVKTFRRNNCENAEQHTAVSIIENVLTSNVLEKLACHIILNHFPLTSNDLEEWTHSPEEYMLVEAGESHKFLLKPCMETLYLGLFYSFKKIIIPLVLNYVTEIKNLNIAELNNDNVLKVSAIYKAVGLASYEIFDALNFNEWFETNLLSILFTDNNNSLLLRQQIIWMIGEWLNVNFSKENRIRLYNIIAMILSSPHQDLVMKLTAAKTLRIAIDDFDFLIDDFTPYMNVIFVAAVDLLICVELCDTKMNILNVLSIMIERIGDKVRGNANVLLQYLPKLWKISEAHNLLRGAVVNVLTHLVKGLDSESEKVQEITLPIIMFSTTINHDAHIYLLEDGLELWVAVLEVCTNMNNDLLNLFQNILPLLERASDTFEICLNITKLYITLDSNVFLEKFGKQLCEMFFNFIGNIQDKSCVQIMEVMRLAMQVNSSIAKDVFFNCHIKMTGMVLNDESYCPLIISIVTILGYLLLFHPVDFQRTLETCHEQSQMRNFENFMSKYLEIWLDKVDYMGLIEKKVSAMALVSLLPQKASFVFEKFGLILDFCVNVLFDLSQNTGDASVTDSLAVSITEHSAKESMGKTRKTLLNDPVYSVVLVDFVQQKLQETWQIYGDQLFHEGMDTLDSQVANQLKSLLK